MSTHHIWLNQITPTILKSQNLMQQHCCEIRTTYRQRLSIDTNVPDNLQITLPFDISSHRLMSGSSQAPDIHFTSENPPADYRCTVIATFLRKWMILRWLFVRSLGRMRALSCVQIVGIIERYLETSDNEIHLFGGVSLISGEGESVVPCIHAFNSNEATIEENRFFLSRSHVSY